MKLWEVDVHLGSGGDTDGVATYLVWAMDEVEAENVALVEGCNLLNATANEIRNVVAISEMDYDGVLGPAPSALEALREGVDPMGPETDRGGLIGQQPY